MIERLLVTGSQDALESFHYRAEAAINVIEQRGRTLFVTVVPGRYDDVLAIAISTNLTVQRSREDVPDGKPPESYWLLVYKGHARPWKPKKRKAA